MVAAGLIHGVLTVTVMVWSGVTDLGREDNAGVYVIALQSRVAVKYNVKYKQ